MTKQSLFWDEYDHRVAADHDHADSADCRCTRCNIANRRKVLELVSAHVQRTEPQNLIFISHLQPNGPLWWMICDDAEVVCLAKKWIEAYPNIDASTDIRSIFPNATLRSPENASPEFWKTPEMFRVWHAVVRARHPEWTFPAAGPHFHVTDHPNKPSQDDDGPIEYGCIPCLDEDDSPHGDDVDDRWVHGFSPGTFCSAHWQEWLEKNAIQP